MMNKVHKKSSHHVSIMDNTLQKWKEEQAHFIHLYKTDKIPQRPHVHGCFMRSMCNYVCLPFMCCPLFTYSCCCRCITCQIGGNACTQCPDSVISVSYDVVNEEKKYPLTWMKELGHTDRISILHTLIEYNNVLKEKTHNEQIACSIASRILHIYEHINVHNHNLWYLRTYQLDNKYDKFVSSLFAFCVQDINHPLTQETAPSNTQTT
jgi:hypothetical protein